jgi:hypothetical protein
MGRDPSEEGGCLNLYAALLNSPPMQVDSDGRSVLGPQQIFRILMGLGTIFVQTVRGTPVVGPSVQWAQQIKNTAAAGIRAASMAAPSTSGGGAAGGVGDKPKNFYRYTGTGWALSLLTTALLSTYSTAYAGANLVLGQRSAQDSYMHSVESGLINTTRGETAWADLDFITASILMTGGSASAALVAWDTYEEGAGAFAAGFTTPDP